MISERTLKKWRKEALMFEKNKASFPEDLRISFEEGARRILRLTQELMDLIIIRKGW